MSAELRLEDGSAVFVDAEMMPSLANRSWSRMGGRLVSVKDPSFYDILDLATVVGGAGAFALDPLDYRLKSLWRISIGEDGAASIVSTRQDEESQS